MYTEPRRKRKHLTEDERAKIEVLHRHGHSQAEIAKEIGVSHQTISKELKRGKVKQLNGTTWEYYYTYSAYLAQEKADYQKTAHSNGLKVGNNYTYLQALETCMLSRYSPYSAIQLVADTNAFDIHISKTTCYRYIDEGLFPNLTRKHLPNAKTKKHKNPVRRMRTTNADKRSIEQRLKLIAARKDFGHWEFDSIVGKAKGHRESLLVLTERKHRIEIILRAEDKTAQATVKALRKLKSYFGTDYRKIFKTITCDNGSEFADQNSMDATGTVIFYCHPSAPHERGSNENANRLLRRWFPKGQSLRKVTQAQCNTAQNWLNHCPRALFGGESAAERLRAELPALRLNHPEKLIQFFDL